jgi:hypothetical protein
MGIVQLVKTMNEELNSVKGEPIDGVGVVVLTIARRYINYHHV